MQLVGEWLQVEEMTMDPDTDLQTIEDTLEGIEGEIEVKADGYGCIIRGIEFEEAALKGRKEYIAQIAGSIDAELTRLQKRREWMENRMIDALIAIGKDEEGIKTDRFEFKIKSSGGAQALKTTDNVPEEFKKTKITVENDNEKIREYIKTHDVEWAWLLPRKKKLSIKGV
jgi:hypothetical protein